MKIIDKIKDMQDVIKYKKRANTALNMLESRNNDYIVSLETTQTLVIQNLELQKMVDKLKNEKKELKKIIEEEMTTKKRK